MQSKAVDRSDVDWTAACNALQIALSATRRRARNAIATVNVGGQVVYQLLNEMADTEGVISEMLRLSSELSIDTDWHKPMYQLLNDIDKVFDTVSQKRSKQGQRLYWARQRTHVQRLTNRLRDAKLEMSMIIAMTNRSVLWVTNPNESCLLLHSKEMHALNLEIQQNVSNITQQMTRTTLPDQKRLERILASMTDGTASSSKRSIDHEAQSVRDNEALVDALDRRIAQVRYALKEEKTTGWVLRTPAVLRRFMGTYLLRQAGSPHSSSPTARLFRLCYMPPSWLFRRMVNIEFTSGLVSGPLLSVRTPRIVRSEDIIVMKSAGVEKLREAFTEEKSSPLDVDERGRSLLWVCIFLRVRPSFDYFTENCLPA